MAVGRNITLDNETLLIRCPERWIRSRSVVKNQEVATLKLGLSFLGFLQSIYDSSADVRIY
jgi:hypothetical protein